jgi:hypothetical protein
MSGILSRLLRRRPTEEEKIKARGGKPPPKAKPGGKAKPRKGRQSRSGTAKARPGTPRKGAASQTAEFESLTALELLVRLLPALVLFIFVLILAPGLPVRAFGTLLDLVRSATHRNPPALVIAPGTPTPEWSLELSPVFTPEVQYWQDEIVEWTVEYWLPPNLIATLMQIESCGNPTVVSSVGASGLFQVMPYHFAEGEDFFDPDTNAKRGLTYFAEGLARANGDVGLALAGYNGGHGAIELVPDQWSAETQDYQYWGSGIYQDAEAGLTESPTLQEWLASGGADLCQQARINLGLAEEGETP